MTTTQSSQTISVAEQRHSLDSEHIFVSFPNLFVSFLSESPILNPYYKEVRSKSEETVIRECELSGRTAAGVQRCNFSYFAAIMASRADKERFSTICEWGNWIFPFDDLFDDGELRNDEDGAKAVMDQLLLSFTAKEMVNADRPAIVRFHDGIWERIKTMAPACVQQRYASAMTEYSLGALAQVSTLAACHLTTPEEMLSFRRRSVCVATLFALVEYGHQLSIPDHVADYPVMKEMSLIGIDLTLMHNDLLSYPKEESEHVAHNILAMYRLDGMEAQEAIDHVGGLVEQRLRQFELLIGELPSWTPEVDEKVRQYVDVVKNVVKANLYWSFQSGRFLSETQKATLRKGGKIAILQRPIF